MWAGEPLHDEEFVEQALHEEAIIQPLDEDTPILQHLNAFNRILSNLLALKVKLEEKALLLLSSLLSSYDHLTTTIMYGKETLELEDVRQILQNNELTKKTDSTKEASRLFIKAIGEDQRAGDPKGIQRLLAVSLTTFVRNQGTSRKKYIKYKEMLKRKDNKNSDGAGTSGKSDQVRVVEEVDEDSCDVLTAELGKDKYSDA